MALGHKSIEFHTLDPRQAPLNEGYDITPGNVAKLTKARSDSSTRCASLDTRSEGLSREKWLGAPLLWYFVCEEGLNVGDSGGCAVGREAGQEGLAVSLSPDARVEEDEDAAVFKRADEAAESLLQSENGFGNLVVEEGFAAGFFYGAHAGLHYGIAGDGKRQAVNDDAAERLALHINALPEA